MNDRRYRQQGYRSPDAPRPAAAPRPAPPPRPADGPRGGGMLGQRTVSRCAACGVVLPVASSALTACPSCRAALRACRQCAHFDPGRRFQCAQPVAERIADKHAANECPHFALRVAIERDATPHAPRAGDARRGFEDLFKK